MERHAKAFRPENGVRLDAGGFYKFRKSGDFHEFQPQTVRAVQKALESNEQEDFQAYKDIHIRRAHV